MNSHIILISSLLIGLSNIYGSHITLLKKEPQGRFKSSHHERSLLNKLVSNNKKIRELLEQSSNDPVIWDGQKKIFTGKTYKGILLNSVVSANLASPILVQVIPNQGLPNGTKFSCFGTTKHERVITLCHKMILKNKEVKVLAQALNLDGSSGLLGEFDDGMEEVIAADIASSLASGFATSAMETIDTGLGTRRTLSLKNNALGALVEGVNTTGDLLVNDLKSKGPVVVIESGAQVLIYFMEALYDY
jgi:hypothetical protein